MHIPVRIKPSAPKVKSQSIVVIPLNLKTNPLKFGVVTPLKGEGALDFDTADLLVWTDKQLFSLILRGYSLASGQDVMG